MKEWQLTYLGYEPQSEGLRETLCALGNGYIVSRAAAPNALADEVHYPGTYLAGGYNRLTSEIAGHRIENEDLVNIPNWLPLTMRIGNGDWIRPETMSSISTTGRSLICVAMCSTRSLRFRDGEGSGNALGRAADRVDA